MDKHMAELEMEHESAAERELEDEYMGSFGDPRRCPRHGEVISSADGMHDGVCGACEHAYDEQEAREQWEALPQVERDRLTAQAEAAEAAYRARFAPASDDDIPF